MDIATCPYCNSVNDMQEYLRTNTDLENFMIENHECEGCNKTFKIEIEYVINIVTQAIKKSCVNCNKQLADIDAIYIDKKKDITFCKECYSNLPEYNPLLSYLINEINIDINKLISLYEN